MIAASRIPVPTATDVRQCAPIRRVASSQAVVSPVTNPLSGVGPTRPHGILSGGRGSSSVVERLLAKEEVASSTLVFRSIQTTKGPPIRRAFPFEPHPPAPYHCPSAEVAEWQTRRSQTPLGSNPCGFESHLRHQNSPASGRLNWGWQPISDSVGCRHECSHSPGEIVLGAHPVRRYAPLRMRR